MESFAETRDTSSHLQPKRGNRHTIINEARDEYKRQNLSIEFTTFLKDFIDERRRQTRQAVEEKRSIKRKLKRIPLKKRLTVGGFVDPPPESEIQDPKIRKQKRSIEKLYKESDQLQTFDDFKKVQQRKFTQEKQTLYYENKKAREKYKKLNKAFSELKHAKLYRTNRRTALNASGPVYTVNSTMEKIHYIMSNPSKRSKKYKIKKKPHCPNTTSKYKIKQEAIQLRSLYGQILNMDFKENHREYKNLHLKTDDSDVNRVKEIVQSVIDYKKETNNPYALTTVAARMGIIRGIFPFHLFDHNGTRFGKGEYDLLREMIPKVQYKLYKSRNKKALIRMKEELELAKLEEQTQKDKRRK